MCDTGVDTDSSSSDNRSLLRHNLNKRVGFRGYLNVDETTPSQSGETSPAAPKESRVLRSEDLFAGQRVLLIEHAGQQYRLLITRNEKLILQK